MNKLKDLEKYKEVISATSQGQDTGVCFVEKEVIPTPTVAVVVKQLNSLLYLVLQLQVISDEVL